MQVMTVDIATEIALIRDEIAWLDRHECSANLPVWRAILATLERQEALSKLAAFGWACLREHRDHMGDIDGFFAQDAAVKTGVLVSRQVSEPCGDCCDCAEFVDFPVSCYFIDDACREVGATLERVAEGEKN